jgi:hypothetical protein
MTDFTTSDSGLRNRFRGTAARGAKQIQRDVRRGARHGAGGFGGPGTYFPGLGEPGSTPYR